MLKIIANNQELDLGGIKGITLQYNPGIFEMDSFEGSFSIPFTLPANEINNTIFNFQHKLSAKNREIVEIQAEIWHSGIQIMLGLLKASEFSDTEIICNFYIENGEIFKGLNQKLLNENDFGGEKAFEIKELYDVDTDEFVLYPVKNVNYYKATVFEADNSNYAVFQNHFITNTLTVNASGPAIVTPFPLLYKVLNLLFLNIGYTLLDSFFTQPNYKTINIFNTANAVNTYLEPIGENYYLHNQLLTYNLSNHLPHISSGEFLKSIQSFFNIFFYVKNDKVYVLDRLSVIESLGFDDLTIKQAGTYKKELTGLTYSGLAFNLQRDSIDVNVNELQDASELIDVQIAPGDLIDYPNPAPYKNLLYQNASYSGIMYANYQQYISFKDLNPGSSDIYWFWFEWYMDWITRGEHESFCNQNGLYLGAKEFEINANLTPLPEYYFGDAVLEYDYYFPKVKQQGNSSEHKVFTPFSLRLMQYNGRRIDVEGITAPHGSVVNGDVYISAYWSYINRWKTYIEWYVEAIKEEYKINLQLSASEIKNFDFSRKKLIDKNLFFVKSFSVQLLRNEIKPVECVLIKA